MGMASTHVAFGAFAIVIAVVLLCIWYIPLDPRWGELTVGVLAAAGVGLIVAGVMEMQPPPAPTSRPWGE